MSAAWRRGPRSTSGASSGSSTRRCGHDRRGGRVHAPPSRVALVHALDDAFVHRGAGLGLGQHALAALIAVAAGVAGAPSRIPRLRPGLRAALAFAFGVLALVNGRLHVTHVVEHGPTGGDVTGVLAAAAGLVLVGARRRDPVAAPRRGHLESRARSPCPPGCSAPSSSSARSRSASSRRTSGASRSASRRARPTRTSPSGPATGSALQGWYRPSANGAAVLVVHGGGSDRKGSVAHAAMLARHGYGVLALRRARARRERGHAEQLRLGLGQGRRGRARLPGAAPPTSTRSGSARSASRPAPTS